MELVAGRAWRASGWAGAGRDAGRTHVRLETRDKTRRPRHKGLGSEVKGQRRSRRLKRERQGGLVEEAVQLWSGINRKMETVINNLSHGG